MNRDCLPFLEQAEATEDLIKISQDLERVQSEIEGLKGKIKYLENQSDFSTITVSIQETAAGANLNNSRAASGKKPSWRLSIRCITLVNSSPGSLYSSWATLHFSR